MVARIWLASFLCRKKPFPRALTAGWCSPLGYLTPSPSPGVLTADCSSPLGCLTPRSGEDGERISQKLHWMRYWLSVGAQPSNYMQLITGSPLNLEGITPVDDSRCGAEESNTCDEVVPGIPYGCSNAPKGYDASAGRIINRSSGPGALLLRRRSRSSSTSLGRTSSRHLSSNSPGPDNQLFDKTNADFRVVQGNNFSLLGQIDADVEEAECEFTEAAVKERYLKHVGPQLTSRGLVLPEKLRHNTTAFVHFRGAARCM